MLRSDGLVRLPFGLVNAYLLRLGLIVITPVHLDHVGSLAAIRRLSGAPVLVHRSEADLLAAGRVVLPAGQNGPARALMGVAAPFARRFRFPPCPPDLTADDALSLAPFGVQARIVHTPGHTGGSLSVLLASGEAVIGDLCQNGPGFGMGMGTLLLPLADAPEAWAGSCARVLNDGARRFWPGHGVPFSAEMLQARLQGR